MGFLAFIVGIAALSKIFEALEGLAGAMQNYAPYISAFVAGLGGYRYMRRLIEGKRAERKEARKEEMLQDEQMLKNLKDRLREELKEEMQSGSIQETGSIQQTARQEARETAEEPYYPETRYFSR